MLIAYYFLKGISKLLLLINGEEGMHEEYLARAEDVVMPASESRLLPCFTIDT
jgi:hypothetical protein